MELVELWDPQRGHPVPDAQSRIPMQCARHCAYWVVTPAYRCSARHCAVRPPLGTGPGRLDEALARDPPHPVPNAQSSRMWHYPGLVDNEIR